VVEWREIGMFLRAEIQKKKGLKFAAVTEQFKIGVAQDLAEKISKMKAEAADIKQLRVKRKINDLFRLKLSDRAALRQLMDQWKSKAMFGHRPLSLKLSLKGLEVQTAVSGTIRLWMQGNVIG
jgi:hypothetical protein